MFFIKLSWSLTMNITPIVSQGIMFLTNPGNIIQALDAKNGELIWEYRYNFPLVHIAVYKDKIFLATYDAHLIALDIRTTYEDGYTQV